MLVAIMGAVKRRGPSLPDRDICAGAIQVCCVILGHLALPYGSTDNPAWYRIHIECAETIAAAGGAAAVVAAMADHPASAAVSASGCGALCHIGLESLQAATSVISSGGLLAVVTALRVHWASVDAPVASFAVRALKCVLGIVKYYSDITIIAPWIKEAIDDGCLPMLLAVLRSRCKDLLLQEYVPEIFRNFAESSPANRAAVVAAGGGEYLHVVAAAHSAPSLTEPLP